MTPYHPQGNGGCERFNQTLLNLLGTLQVDQQNRWVEYLPSLVHSFNNSVHSSTGYAPTYLMFGRHMRLPLDVLWGTTEPEGVGSISEWVAQHHKHLEYAYSRVSENLGVAAGRMKRFYDRTVWDAPLLPGERVLVQNNCHHGQGKLNDRWESQLYMVLCHHPDSPIYTVRPEGRQGPDRVLHRNLLRPCPHYPAEQMAENPTSQPQQPNTGWAWVPMVPVPPVLQDDPDTESRQSQRATRGRPPERYGDWGQ